MRRLLLAPLLLAGCTGLAPDGTIDTGPWFTHDGYALSCKDVQPDACVPIADELAARYRAQGDQPIVSITVAVDGRRTVCWGSTAGNRCKTSTQ